MAGPKGSRLVTEDEFRQLMRAHSGKEFQGAEFSNNLVEILNEETAVISYEYTLKGKTYLDVSTWVNQNGNWICAFHSEVPKLQ